MLPDLPTRFAPGAGVIIWTDGSGAGPPVGCVARMVVMTKLTLPEEVVAVTVAGAKEVLGCSVVARNLVCASPLASVFSVGWLSVPMPCVMAQLTARPATGCPKASLA